MRELIQSEIAEVSGGGFISQIGGMIGDFVGDAIYPSAKNQHPFYWRF